MEVDSPGTLDLDISSLYIRVSGPVCSRGLRVLMGEVAGW